MTPFVVTVGGGGAMPQCQGRSLPEAEFEYHDLALLPCLRTRPQSYGRSTGRYTNSSRTESVKFTISCAEILPRNEPGIPSLGRRNQHGPHVLQITLCKQRRECRVRDYSKPSDCKELTRWTVEINLISSPTHRKTLPIKYSFSFLMKGVLV